MWGGCWRRGIEVSGGDSPLLTPQIMETITLVQGATYLFPLSHIAPEPS